MLDLVITPSPPLHVFRCDLTVLVFSYKVEIPKSVKIRWFAFKFWSDNHEIIFQDRQEGFMKNASCFIFVCPIKK